MDIVKEGITILQSTGHVRSYNSFFAAKKSNTDEYFTNHMSTMSLNAFQAYRIVFVCRTREEYSDNQVHSHSRTYAHAQTHMRAGDADTGACTYVDRRKSAEIDKSSCDKGRHSGCLDAFSQYLGRAIYNVIQFYAGR